MSVSDKYFQFPLAAIRLNKNLNDVDDDLRQFTIAQIVDYCLQVTADNAHDRDPDEVEDVAEAYHEEHPGTEKPKSREVQRIFWAAEVLGVAIQSPINRPAMRAIQQKIDNVPGGRRMVRVRADLLWDARDSKRWCWRDFAILCAIYAGVGDRDRHRLSFDFINTMANGCSNAGELARGVHSDLLLTRRQVRSTIESLDSRKLYVRASLDGRRMWYSNRMSQPELMESLVEEKVQQTEARKGQREITLAMQRAIEQRLGGASR
ncbi:hypothetical protein RISK_004942 [Rhodopirellula islandica]|uniref:Uncharacterized protein n=1 Tax=Rhodopirellula islandica TaxID=595434 RepID=A0A0J1B8C3_RHOIS|nr:hypothetical protein [Rhodopirellula islandica]KLU02972.1 hypothetical protein RISK_004942 [Rhodopirellula islandica]